jgi:transcriptional regulator with XRE-family HTH domain
VRLGRIIADYRFANNLGVRAVAQQIGVSHATLSRVERGEACDGATLVAILRWLTDNSESRKTKS